MTEEELFARVTEMPARERSAFLRRECGDDEALRRGVEELLELFDSGPTLLVDKPCEETAEISLDEMADMTLQLGREGGGSELPEGGPEQGDKILYFGDYEIGEEIARGSMGVVYRARQTSLDRSVALKMIRGAYTLGEIDVARFRLEASSAAGLDHPNIVPVYDIGEHQGQQYYSMKLVEGGTLVDRGEALRKDRRAAVRLMAKVARAIHAAHQHGILHRDIKPGNILIDKEGEPHVADFGLAKQMGSESGLTLSGQIVGTPYFMAPEQAKEGTKEVSMESDVYSLGAVFYDLLTGRPPIRGESIMETLSRVIHEEAKSMQLADPTIGPELDTIVLKCLEKDPARRYGSASELADELERWLKGEPILARSITTPQRLVKWARRKPVHAVAWVLGVTILMILGLGGPLVAFRQAKLANEAQQAGLVSDLARQDADEISMFLTDMLSSASPGDPRGGREVKVVDLLEDAAKRLETDFLERPDLRAALQGRIGETYYSLGLHREAIGLLNEAWDRQRQSLGADHQQTLKTLAVLSLCYQNAGMLEKALELGEEHLRLCHGKFGQTDGNTLLSRNNLATTHELLGRSIEALEIREELVSQSRIELGLNHKASIAMMHSLANSYDKLGRQEEALNIREHVLDARRKLDGVDHPETLNAINNLASSYLVAERVAEATALYEELMELRQRILGDKNPQTLGSMNNLAACYFRARRAKEALDLREKVLSLQREVSGPEHRITLMAMTNLATSYYQLGRLPEAVSLQEKAVDLKQRILPPGDRELIVALNNLAVFYRDTGRESDEARIRNELKIQRSGARRSE